MLRMLVSAVIASTFAAAAVAQAPDTTLRREQLGEGIYLFRASSDLDLWTASNTLVIVNDDDVTVFDTATRPATNQRIIGEIRRLTNKPVRTLINSHWHMDHWSGNDEYARAFPGLRIISTTQQRDYMSRMTAAYFGQMAGGGIAQAQAALDSAIRTGRQSDGTPLTPEIRQRRQRELDDNRAFGAEIGAIPRVLPNVAFTDTMVFWSGRREFRLYRATGDATGEAVMYLPAERILATGDVLVSPEDGQGPPPWTTNSNSITPWLVSLRGLQTLNASIVVPGQGPAMRDASYLATTADLFASLIDQVHVALERGAINLAMVQAAVNVDAIVRRYPGGDPSAQSFRGWQNRLVRRIFQESLDGAGREN